MPVISLSPNPDTHRTRRRPHAATALGVVLALALSPVAQAEAPAQGSSLSATLPSFAPMVEKVLPAVVNISAIQKGTQGDDGSDQGGDNGGQDNGPESGPPGQGQGPWATPYDWFRRFFDQNPDQQQSPGMPGPQMPDQGPQQGAPDAAPEQKIVSLGSGFIIDPRGFIVTNNHVIGNARKVTVIFQDQTRHPAKIIGVDEKTDLAILKIESPTPLPFVNLGDSDKARVGDWVIAVGNPFGLFGTVTKGIISARARPIESSNYVEFLQIDAAINKGNSGGPTFDLDGDVIGINTAIYSPNGGSVGIGFAIPSNTAAPIIAQLLKHGRVDRGWLGVEIQEVTPNLAQTLGLPRTQTTGALVVRVTPGGPADKAGLQAGDIIEKFNGKTVPSSRDLPPMVGDTPVGSPVDVTVLRQGASVALSVTLGKLPDQVAATATSRPDEENPADIKTALGLYLSSLNPQIRKRLGIADDVQGALVSRVDTNSPAANNDIEPGDIVTHVNSEPVDGPEAAAKLINGHVKDDPKKGVALLINRHGENIFVPITPNNADGSDDDGQ